MSETTPTPSSPAREPDHRECSPGCAGCVPACGCQRTPTAPCLTCQAGLCAEHGPTVTATTTGAPAQPQPEPGIRTDASAPPKGSKAWAIQEACRIVGIAFHGIAEYDEASDCFCSESPHQDYRNGGQALAFVEAAVKEKLAREKAPATPAEATGEMTPPHGIRCDRCLAGVPHERDRHCYSIAQLMEHIAALRTRAREAEERAEMYVRIHRQEVMDGVARLTAAFRERDEAREQRDAISDQREDLSNEILVERAARVAAEAQREAYRQDRDLTAHRLAAAEAEVATLKAEREAYVTAFVTDKPVLARENAALREEVKRLRIAYDDPSLDATDGAHPAWWRGNDAGVAGAVRIVNEALDGPLPLAGCVGGADLEAVRQRVAAIRASVARLVEAGDEARDILNAILDNQYTYRERVDAVDRWVARWAAAKAGRALDAPAGSEAKR